LRGVTRTDSFAVRVPSASSVTSSTFLMVAFAGRPYLYSSSEFSSGLSQPWPSQTMNRPGPVRLASIINP
jgi:hypothetical protein